MSVFLHGLSLANYRSFGPTIQRIYPFTTINLFAGLNNSGKSNILRFLHEHLLSSAGRGQVKLDENLDFHRASNTDQIIVGISRPSDDPQYKRFRFPYIHTQQNFDALLASKCLTHDTGYVWSDQRIQHKDNDRTSLLRVDDVRRELGIGDSEWREIWQSVQPGLSGGSRDGWIGSILQVLSPFNGLELPKVSLVPAIRRIGEPNAKHEGLGGVGIIDCLAQLQDPDHHEEHKSGTFERICQFVRNVTGSDTATIKVPYNRERILVGMDGKTLPLDSLGTGIHEVVILAVAASLLRNSIVCIEEPEIHLHPALERKLLQYLKDKTTNQYFITTHSPHILDMPDCSVFHVRLEGGMTAVRFVGQSRERWEVCRDLGCRPSDLVQANCVIWVEGPSDRVYLNHWINAVAPELIEGVHYTLMFYGGKLLAHLSADDPEVTQFISLCSLNRNMAIVIDSDFKSSKSVLNDTKARIIKEFGDRLTWVTAGREVENYVDHATLKASVEKLYEGRGDKVGIARFDKALPYIEKRCIADKVRVAHEVANRAVVLDVLDLREKIEALVKFIRAASA
jgi:hypothetical protein